VPVPDNPTLEVSPIADGQDDLAGLILPDTMVRGQQYAGAQPLFAEVHDEIAGLLRGPRPVWVLGDAEDVQEAVAHLEREQDVEPPQRDRAVDVEEVDRQHAGGLGAQELLGWEWQATPDGWPR
jgi:hypothetical protein